MANSNLIWRIDDRLIHGQVIIGWCSQLPIRLLVVCDDDIVTTEWEKNLLLMAAPPELPTFVLSTSETARRVQEWLTQDIIVMILLKSPHVLKKLIDLQVPISRVNVGGIHYQENRREYLSYLYLSEDEVKLFQSLIDLGIKFECQDLPNAPVLDLKKIIEKRK
ncbi:MAG: hypothetical protein Kow0042_22690 [Calditrichia bacterium]